MSGQTHAAGELRGAARGGAVTLVGSGLSAALGFVVSLVLARTLGAGGSGVVLQTVAAFTIALSVARFGMDTAAVWVIPRVRSDDPALLRGTLTALLLPTVLAGAALAALGWVALSLPGVREGLDPAVVRAMRGVLPFLPFGALMMVALAATRGFGGVLPFNLVGNIAVPLARPLLIVAAVAAGAAAAGAAVAWAAPLLPAAAVALWVLGRQLRGVEQRRGVEGSSRPDGGTWRRVLSFGVPRTLASFLEQALVWLDVVLVGLVAGSAAAGVYGAAARFVSAGVIVSTALRIVVAPRFSAHLARGQAREVQTLYTTTARWILLFGAPIYVLLAWYAPTVLSWLGPGFAEGRSSMVVLCLGSLVVLAAGNIQSLLLMSGRTGWGAVNKLVVVAFNLVGNLLLVPHIGIVGAALTWAASMALDSLLAVLQVRRFTGVRPQAGAVLGTLLVAGACASVPSLLAIWLLGNTVVSLLLATPVSAALLLAYCAADRRRLAIDALLAIRRP